MSALAVVRPGARTTVEDLGRDGYGAAGVPAGGAFDALALVAANRLVGNADDAAGLEVTLHGPELRLEGDAPRAVAIVGADFAALATGANGARALSPDSAAHLLPGEALRLGAGRDGARAWVAVAGGIDVPIVLASRSTCVAGGFGGLAGRPLRAGDRLPLGVAGPRPTVSAGTPWTARADTSLCTLRILSGPQAELFPGDPRAALEATLWRVERDSDRVGVRLAALDPAVARRLAGVAGTSPEGTTAGAIQITPDGGAIVLGPDRPVTGGYAKPALVAAADLGALAWLRPGDRVRFARIELAEAIALHAARRAALPEPS